MYTWRQAKEARKHKAPSLSASGNFVAPPPGEPNELHLRNAPRAFPTPIACDMPEMWRLRK
jgi:hypothetical protein